MSKVVPHFAKRTKVKIEPPSRIQYGMDQEQNCLMHLLQNSEFFPRFKDMIERHRELAEEFKEYRFSKQDPEDYQKYFPINSHKAPQP